MRREARLRIRSAVLVLSGCALLAGACSSEGDGTNPFGPPADESPPTDDGTSPFSASAATVPVGVWTPTDYLAGNGSFLPIVADRGAQFEFFPSGELSGSTGCQGFTGTYAISGPYTEFGGISTDDDGQSIAIGNLADDGADCVELLADQHTDLLTAIDSARRWVDLGGGTVVLRNVQGANVVVATREQ